MMKQFVILCSVLTVISSLGCREVGFRDLEEENDRASIESARSLLGQVRRGLEEFYRAKQAYPRTTETHLYDSVRNFLPNSVDASQLYRNDRERGYYLAVGGRNNRLIYHYPPSIGSGKYTLYWVGPNGVDEKGDGDDIPGWEDEALDGLSKERTLRKLVDLRNDGSELQLILEVTGLDFFNDTAKFSIREGDSVLFRDRWPLKAYFELRPELAESEREKSVRDEIEQFFELDQFVRTDSLFEHDWVHWADLTPKSSDAQEISKANGLMFNYYKGSRGSTGVVWSPVRKAFVKAWKST